MNNMNGGGGAMEQTSSSIGIVTGETPSSLRERWKTMKESNAVIAFYGDKIGKPWREFSNFYQRQGHGYDFTVPSELFELSNMNEQTKQSFSPTVVHCDFSEKAIMLCKAAVMGDAQSYAKIVAATTPQEAKRLGRQVTPFDHERWNTVVCGVAKAISYQKFVQVPDLRRVLLSTGDRILCEATARDTTWAIGISIKMEKIYDVPARWKGSNVLGWALMEVRAILRQEEQDRDDDNNNATTKSGEEVGALPEQQPMEEEEEEEEYDGAEEQGKRQYQAIETPRKLSASAMKAKLRGSKEKP
jgi:ribA/ribD-fused uncharacterized protein